MTDWNCASITEARNPLRHYPLSIINYSFLLFLLAFSGASAQLHYNDFSSTAGLSLVGSAVARGGLINLTPGRMNDVGGVWATQKQHIRDGFITRFSFIIRDTLGEPDVEGKNGGDGLAFVVQNRPTGAATLGPAGGHMGYGQIGRLLAVEFDTYKNAHHEIQDPDGNHASIQVSGSAHANSWGAATNLRMNLSDGRIHTATVEYVNGTLRVYLDACAPTLLETDIDLSQFADADGNAWVGFTSATGSAWEAHQVIAWQFNPLGAVRTYSGNPCDAESVTLTVRGDFLSYRWSTGATGRSITVNRSGTYTVTIADTNACSGLTFSWTEAVQLNGGEKPVVQVTGSASFCQGDSVVLTGPENAASYRWSTGETTRSIIARTPGRYAVTIIDARGCSLTSDSITVTVTSRPAPVVTAGGPLTFCAGGSVLLVATDGYPSYQWSDGRSGRSITVTESGRYAVTVGTSGCRGTSDTVVVEVMEAPQPALRIVGGSSCDGDTVVLDAGADYASYLWSNGERTRSITVRNPGDYFVTVTNEPGCPGTSDTVTIQPGGVVLPTISASGDLPFCIGDSVTLTVDQIYQSYIWNNGATGRSLVVRSGGRFTVTVTDTAGCVTEASIDLPQPLTPPVVQITSSGPATPCEGQSVTLGVDPSGGPVLWSTGSTEAEIVITSPGTYHVTVGTGGCAVSDTIRIDFGPGPIANAGGDRQICVGESVTLQASGGTTYSWSPAIGLSCIDCPSPVATPSTTTRYIVEVGDGRPCTSFDTVVVTVMPAGQLDAGPDLTICSGDSVTLNAVGATAVRWSPSSGLSCTDCSSPTASPAVTTTYIVMPTDAGSCMRPDTITIGVDSVGLVIGSYIERIVFGDPGDTVTAALVLETRSFVAGVDSIDLEIRYNPAVARPAIGSDPSELLSGTVLAGWRIDADPIVPGRLVLHTGSSGAGLLTGGRIVNLPFVLYLGDSTGTELTYDLIAHGNRCLTIETRDGRVAIDSICGLSVRLIEMGATKYALREIAPNPAVSGATVSFAIGLDAPTTIRLFDQHGREVGRPIDEHLQPGEYQLQLETAALPSGVYLLRLESGRFFATRRLVIRR